MQNTVTINRLSVPKRFEDTLLDQVSLMSQSELLEVLYDGKSPILSAPPEGFTYIKIQKEKKNTVKRGRIGYFGPHPSDLPDFIGGITSQLHNASMNEFLLTEGELGASPLSEDETRRIRRQEAIGGSIILENIIKVLSKENGIVLPDGDVLSHMDEATQLVKQTIQHEELSIIIAPGPEADHPDHVATFLAVMQALCQLGQEGYFIDKEIPAVYLTDPEYGYGSGGSWAKEKIEAIVHDYPYLKQMEAFVTPDYIVDISAGMQKATAALLMHATQMEGKEYLWKIPMLKRVRGLQIGVAWAEGLRQVIFPGVSSNENKLAEYLPEKSMFILSPKNYFTNPNTDPLRTKSAN